MSDIDLLKAAIFTPGDRGWGLPLLFWGQSGVGKSDIIEELGRVWRMHVEVLSPGERGEGAFGVTGVPKEVRGKDGKLVSYVLTYPAPDWIESFEDFGGRGIVFVDEITTAAPMIQAAMLGLIRARRIGSGVLPHGVRVIGAGNPPEIAAGGWQLSPPMANRVGHMQWDPPSGEAWADWLLTHDVHDGAAKAPTQDPEREEKRVLQAWTSEWAKARGLVTAFIRKRPTLLHQQPKFGDPKAHGAWPSHRTWVEATRAIASTQVHGLNEDDTASMVSGFIGDGAAKEFIAWRVSTDLPDPADVLDGKVQWHYDEARLDRSMAVISSTAVFLTNPDKDEKRRTKRAQKMWEILDSVSKHAPDVALVAIKPLHNAKLLGVEGGVKVLARMRPTLEAAGVGI